MWLPMSAWMATRTETIVQDPQLMNWLLLLLATNTVSFVVDLLDSAKYLSGERAPYYQWRLAT